jgi:AAA15 family ATPase/GTPase
MRIIHYIKLHNFKVFGEEKTIELDQPSVLIGPNNSGKTSVLQALALWSIGMRKWYDSKSNSKASKNLSSGINRLEIIQVPVQEARYYWKNTEIRKGSNTPAVPLEITLGLEFEGVVHDCKISFTHYTPELIYCVPNETLRENKKLLEYASELNIQLLYPMSGMSTEEIYVADGRMNVLLGEGKTAEVLRNLCWSVARDESNDDGYTEDWFEIFKLFHKLFNISLEPPNYNTKRGSITLHYRVEGVRIPLDISLAGRGLQQMLLLVVYLYYHKNSVILLDEPDAHLEILRQRTVFTVLNDIATRNGCQLIMATHSEVILEEAIENNLVLLVEGECINLTKKQDVRNAIKHYSIEHYYKARLKKHILYIEGSTDIEILKQFALLLEHPAYNILSGDFNYYYLQNIEPENTLYNKLNRSEGYFESSFEKHFNAVKAVVSELKGIALLDSDGRTREDSHNNDLYAHYWSQYELENYFVRPEALKKYFHAKVYAVDSPPFQQQLWDLMEEILNEVTLELIFKGIKQEFFTYNELPDLLKDNYWLSQTKNVKMSSFLEKFFQLLSQKTQKPILLNKGRFYELVPFFSKDKIDNEIVRILDKIVEIMMD